MKRDGGRGAGQPVDRGGVVKRSKRARTPRLGEDLKAGAGVGVPPTRRLVAKAVSERTIAFDVASAVAQPLGELLDIRMRCQSIESPSYRQVGVCTGRSTSSPVSARKRG